MTAVIRICFVCSGNICRSPTAEVVLTHQLRAAELADIVVDSAGTGSWHTGDDMDARSRRTLEQAGYTHPRHRAKQFTPVDFAERDLVIALDREHETVLRHLAGETDDALGNRAKIVLLRSFEPNPGPHARDLDVADPYYGGAGGFEQVLGQIEGSCAGLLSSLRERPALQMPPQQADSPPK